MSYDELMCECETTFRNLKITPAQAKKVEALTRDQAGSKQWFYQRAGRVTASRFKAAVHTSGAQQSLSLIKTICYPEAYKFKTEATAWGCKHEKTAKDEYLKLVKDSHDNFIISESGLIIHVDYPYLGASPDGCIKCDCCGKGVLEIKCMQDLHLFFRGKSKLHILS